VIKLMQREAKYSTESCAREQVSPGAELYGYLCGAFGRDSYGTKTVTEVVKIDEGIYQIRAVDEDGVHHTSFDVGENAAISFYSLVKSSNDALKEME